MTDPGSAWAELQAGNRRFVDGVLEHPHQDVGRREQLEAAQTPIAAIFGCSDSRLSAEIIFDLGLGDAFVIRNAGQVVSESVVGSIEYAVAVLGVPLLVVLAHDSCGAVRAAIDATGSEPVPLPPHVASLIAPIVPAVLRVESTTDARTVDPAGVDAAAVGLEHLRSTVSALLTQSEIVAQAVADGSLAVVGANYRLREGRVVTTVVVGDATAAGAP